MTKRFIQRQTNRTGDVIKAAAVKEFGYEDNWDLIPMYDDEGWVLVRLMPVVYRVEGTGPNNITFLKKTENVEA